MVDIAKKIRMARAEKKWSQEELAEKLGCSQNAVSQWERLTDPVTPSGLYLIKICKLFGMDIKDFPEEELI